MKTKMTVNGVSVCPTGEERHEYFTLSLSPRRKKRLCQYDYRHTDGELFSCVASLKEWIDGYESTRFTQIGDHTAVITSEYNAEHVQEWLQRHIPIASLISA